MIHDSTGSLDKYTFNETYVVAENVLFRQVENEGILMHIPSGNYFSLSETGILFWQALSGNKPLGQIIDTVITEYEVDREIVVADLCSFLQGLLDSNLISESPN